MEERRIAQEIELHSYLNKLITDDKEAQVKKIREEESDNEQMEEKLLEMDEKIVRRDDTLMIVRYFNASFF